MINICNMKSPTTGKEVPNQFIIYTGIGAYFQSYSSIIAFKPYDQSGIVLSQYWDYSKTTGKYRNVFLRETHKKTLQKITENTYKLVHTIEIR